MSEYSMPSYFQSMPVIGKDSFAMESHTGCGCLRLNKLSHRLSAMQMNSNILWNLQSLPCICLWEQNDIR